MKLAIDAGHGLLRARPPHFDPGALGGGLREADITLSYAAALQFICEQRGIEHFMTRASSAEEAPLGERARRAMDAGCTHLLSIHCNAAADPRANGTETLFRHDQSFARLAQRAALDALQLRDRGLKHRPGLAILRFSGPCALVELGFISHNDDRAAMTRPEARWSFARSFLNLLNGVPR